MEQVRALAAEYAKLSTLEEAARRTTNGEPVWLPFGPEPWLVRTNPRLGDLPASVVVVRAGPIFVGLGEPGFAGPSTAPAPGADHSAAVSRGSTWLPIPSTFP